MKVSELSGDWLNHYVAKAEGHQWRYPWMLGQGKSIREWQGCEEAWGNPTPPYSTEWYCCGPLIEKYDLVVGKMRDWHAIDRSQGARGDNWIDAGTGDGMQGATPQEAICRAVVQSVFGDEVPDVPD